MLIDGAIPLKNRMYESNVIVLYTILFQNMLALDISLPVREIGVHLDPDIRHFHFL